jgi:hypothetical protein
MYLQLDVTLVIGENQIMKNIFDIILSEMRHKGIVSWEDLCQLGVKSVKIHLLQYVKYKTYFSN